MQKLILLSALYLFLSGCKSRQAAPVSGNVENPQENFFPLSSYMLGQVNEVMQLSLNPMLLNDAVHPDTVFLKREDLPSALRLFTDFNIDTTNMKPFFRESKFLDETLHAYTFLYEPKEKLPDSFKVQQWAVYVNPESGLVSRVNMIHKASTPDSTFQLTWDAAKGQCIINTYLRQGDSAALNRSDLIKWKY